MDNDLKVVLGTVQFGINYGISNKIGILMDEDLKQLLTVAGGLGIKYLDTAFAYGNAEERIGKLSSGTFQVITKFPASTEVRNIHSVLHQSFERLRVTSVYGFMAHNANDIIEDPKIWEKLQELKYQKKVEKIGYSLYHPRQLEKLFELGCIPDIVQLPFSIFDRNFESWLDELKKKSTEVHARSIFLQGLYFLPPSELPDKLKDLERPLMELNRICKLHQFSIEEVALGYVAGNKNISRIVIGVENEDQLRKNISIISKEHLGKDLITQINEIRIENQSLLNPSNW